MFVFWQFGFASALAKTSGIEGAQLFGASAGSITAVLLACGINFAKAAEIAFDLATKNKLLERKMGSGGTHSATKAAWNVPPIRLPPPPQGSGVRSSKSGLKSFFPLMRPRCAVER